MRKVGRHAYGDQYQAVEMPLQGPGHLYFVLTPEEGGPRVPLKHLSRFTVDGSGVALAMHNTDAVIGKVVGRIRMSQYIFTSEHSEFCTLVLCIRLTATLAALFLHKEQKSPGLRWAFC